MEVSVAEKYDGVLRGPNGIFSRWVYVTPDIAKDYLDRNLCEGDRKNRKRSEAYVNRLAQEISRGWYHSNHQGIAFDNEGNLIDGQNRLAAVLEASKRNPEIGGLWLMVSEGLSVRAITKIDAGKPRADADHLRISTGTSASNVLISVLRLVLVGFRVFKGDKVTTEQFLAMINEWPEEVAFVNKHQNMMHVRNRFVLAPCVRAMLAGEPVDRIQEFTAVLSTGIHKEGEADFAAIVLRNQMLDGRLKIRGNTATHIDLYRKVETALVAFLRRRPLKVIRGTDIEQFPLPVDRVPESCRSFL